jgi:autotransporter-associated beta strand protein
MKKVFLSALAASALIAPGAFAQNATTWTGSSNSTFSANGNWAGNIVPASSTTADYAIFAGSPTVNQPSMTATRSIAGLDFQSAGWTLSGASALTVGAFGIDSAGSGNNTVSAPITVGAAGGNWTIGSGNTLDLSGILTMSNAFTVNGNGTLRLSGSSANSGTGVVTISSGSTVEINKGSGVVAFVDAQVVNVSGTVKWLQAGNATSTTQFTVNTGAVLDLNGNNATFAFSGNQKITLSGGTVQTGLGTWTFAGNNASDAIVNGTTVSTITGITDLGGNNRGVTVSDNATGVDFNWAAKITDASQGVTARTLTFNAGSGTPEVVLGGNNDYRGTTTINSGVTVYADNANALGSTSNGTTVSAGGTLALRGSLTYAAESVILAFSTTASLRSVSGDNVWTGNLTNPGGSPIPPTLIQVDAGSLTMNGTWGSMSSARKLATQGAGAFIDNATNLNTQPLYVNGGVYADAVSGRVNAKTSPTVLNGGAIAAPDNITMGLGSAASTVRFGDAGGGFAAYGANINVNVGNATATLVWGGGTVADAPVATVAGGVITALGTTYFGGAGYSGTVNLTFTGGNGTGAAGTATLTNGAVTGFTMTNNGTGYTSAPTVGFAVTPGNGGTANFLADNAPLILNSVVSTNVVTFKNGLDLAAGNSTFTGQREIRVLDNPASTADRAVIDSVISSTKSGIGINKTGAGVLELAAGRTMTYSGNTTVTAGTLLVNGGISGTGAVNVSGTSTLGGNGSIGGATTIASTATLSPGNSPGNLTFNNDLTLAGAYKWELAALSTSLPGTNFDTITVTAGNVDITGATINLTLGAFAPTNVAFWQSNQTWAGILNNTGAGSLNGTFAAIDNSSWSSLGAFTTSYTGNDVNLVWTAVPEPATWALLAFSMTTVMVLRRRRSS